MPIAKQRKRGLAENLWYAYLPVEHGNNRTEFFAAIAEHLGKFGNDVIRFTQKEQIQVRNITEDYLPDIYQFFKKIGDYQIDYPVVVTNMTSCTGADTCRLGICLPKGAINAVTRRPDDQWTRFGCNPRLRTEYERLHEHLCQRNMGRPRIQRPHRQNWR
jgi:sulfite reductase beta subunit-like hemoprotein